VIKLFKHDINVFKHDINVFKHDKMAEDHYIHEQAFEA
jgi:hypothetical protein